MKFKVSDKEYTIKFGLKPCLKTHLITEVAGAESKEYDSEIELVENILEVIPKMLLVGLQVYHFDEFGYDYDNKAEENAKLDLAYDLLDKYISEGGDFSELYGLMQEDLLNNSFLSGLFKKEMDEQTKKKPAQTSRAKK